MNLTLTPRQHDGIGYEATLRAIPGTIEYLIVRARLAALVFLGITYGVDYDGGPWEPFAGRLAQALDGAGMLHRKEG